MTPDQLTTFREHGVLSLSRLVPKSLVEPVKQDVLAELKRLGIWSGGKRLSGALNDMPAFQQVTRLGQLVRVPDLQRRVITDPLLAAVEAVGGAQLASSGDAQLLLSLPHQEAGPGHRANWHVDIAANRSGSLPGVQAFVLVDDVLPGGGATLAIAGSHLVTASRTAHELRALLSSNTDPTSDLAARGLRVVEMSGRAGDTFLMDMRVLHSPSINTTAKVRMMATARYFVNP